MLIKIYPSHGDTYNSITIDTDSLIQFPVHGTMDFYPSIFLDDVISDLIDKH